MDRNLIRGRVNFDFLDGYLLSALREELQNRGIDESGLLEFYASRVSARRGAILDYEEAYANYLLANCRNQRVLEIGTGMGELPVVLALNGVRAGGLEYYEPTYQAAARIRSGLALCFPELASDYELILGAFPENLMDTKWTGPDVTLVFTNVGAGWDEERIDAGIAYFQSIGEAILDLRLFGVTRNTGADRDRLFHRIAGDARAAERLEGFGPDRYVARFTFLRTA